MSRDCYELRDLRVDEVPMAALTASIDKSSTRKISNKITHLSRHLATPSMACAVQGHLHATTVGWPADRPTRATLSVWSGDSGAVKGQVGSAARSTRATRTLASYMFGEPVALQAPAVAGVSPLPLKGGRKGGCLRQQGRRAIAAVETSGPRLHGAGRAAIAQRTGSPNIVTVHWTSRTHDLHLQHITFRRPSWCSF